MAQRSQRKGTRSQAAETKKAPRPNPRNPAGGARIAVLSVSEYLELLTAREPGEGLEKSPDRRRLPSPLSGGSSRLREAEEALQQIQAALEAFDPDKVPH